MMPARADRSGTRGRPPFGFGGSGGSRGSIRFQSSSGTNGLPMMPERNHHRSDRNPFC
jgi:hypothetical protein